LFGTPRLRLGGIAKRTFKSSQPRLGGVDKRALPLSGTRPRSLFRLGGVVKHTLSPFQKLPAPVSGALMSVHNRPRGRGLGAFSDSAASSSTHYRPFKSSQPPSRGRRQTCTPALGDEASEPFQTRRRRRARATVFSKAPSPRLGGVDERAQPPSGTRARSLFSRGRRQTCTPRPRGRGLEAFTDSGASMSVHPRPRGRGLGALSDSASSSSTHYRPFKSSQPPSRGR